MPHSEGTYGLAFKLVGRAHARGVKLATAESCTGGQIASALTSVPGASEVYQGGVVTYSNELKEWLLGVSEELLVKHGAVSEEVASAMAQGAHVRLGADFAVSVTGIAGPGGGTVEKPVGLVYIGIAGANGPQARQFNFQGERAEVQRQAVEQALLLMLAALRE